MAKYFGADKLMTLMSWVQKNGGVLKSWSKLVR